jgi:hypothetical protein
MTATAVLAAVAPPKCPDFCVKCVNQMTEPSTDSAVAWHMGRDAEVVDEYDGDQIRAVVTVERMDDRHGTGQVRVHIDAQGSLSVAKARKLIAALAEQVAIAEAAR